MLKISKWIKIAINLDEAYKLFNLNRNSTINDLRTVYRDYSLKYHPDHGGDKTKMSMINQAKDLIENDINKKQKKISIQDNIENIKHIITSNFTQWKKYLSKYMDSNFKLTFDEKIEDVFYTVIVNLTSESSSFIIKLRCFDPYGKVAIHYNVKHNQQTIVPENNRRLSLTDLMNPEFFFPDNVMRILYPIIITDNFEIANKEKVVDLILALGAKKIDERTFQLGGKIIQRNNTKVFKTPSWTVHDNGNTKIYIETFDTISMGKNIKAMLKHIKE